MDASRSRSLHRLALAGAILAVAAPLHAEPPVAGGGLQLVVGVAPDDGNPDTCGTATSLALHAGDAINFCYTLTNGTGTTLGYHTLVDSVDGDVFALLPHALAPGESFQSNRIVYPTEGTWDYQADWTAQDFAPGYAAVAGTPAFIDIRATGTPLSLGDDTAAGVTLPFQVTLYESTSNLLSVGNNGTIALGTLDGFSYAFNTPVPDPFAAPMGGALILPFWDDFDVSTGGVYWQVFGSAPSRRVVVQWERAHFLQDQGQPASFEVILGEDGSISFQYANTVLGDPDFPEWDGGGSATVGLQDAAGAIGNLHSFDTPALGSPDAIDWVATDPQLFTAQASVHLDVAPALLPPTIHLTPDPVTATGAPGGAAVSVPLQLSNDGDVALEWSLQEAPGSGALRTGSMPAPIPARSGDEVRKIAANDATRDSYRSHVAPFVPMRGGITPGCDEATPGILVHDDGTPEDGYTDGSGLFPLASYVDRFTPTSYPATFTSACVSFLSHGSTSAAFELVVYDDSGWDGSPGNELAAVPAIATGIPSTAVAAFTRVDLSGLGLVVEEGSVYIGVRFNPLAPGDIYIASDVDGQPNVGAGFHSRGAPGAPGGWDPTIDQFADYHALLVRAVEQPARCATPADLPWLSLDVVAGSIEAHAATTVTATFDPSQLEAGEHAATLCIDSNDPARPHLAVPVRFQVDDTLFADGFDGAAGQRAR